MEKNALIEVSGLSKKYKSYHALNNLNFKVYEGEIFGFLGPSGAGKTTTIKILTGQLKQTSGSAYILKLPAEKVTEDIYQEIGIVSDMSGIYERLTVYQNLAFFGKLFSVNQSYIEELLRKFGLFDHRDKLAGKLSKGMKQRLVLIRAILHKPKILFLDEPTSGLDPVSANSVHDILDQLRKQGTAIFLTTHNMDEAEKLCDRIALLNEGFISELDTPAALRKKFNRNKQFKVQLTDQTEAILDDSEHSLNKIKDWFSNHLIETIHSCEPTLEQVFLEATGRKLI